MKRFFLLSLCCIAAFYGCQCGTKAPVAQVQAPKDNAIDAICRYLTDLGVNYAPAEYCIPYCLVVECDTTQTDEMLVWGEFWVQNYNMAGDTLKSISGGRHPGCMHIKKTDGRYEVTQFDAVSDGAEFEASAKAIFGKHYEAFILLNANDEKMLAARTKSILDYAAAHDLKVSYYEDYGWMAVKLEE